MTVRNRGLPRPSPTQDWHEWADQLCEALEAGGASGEVGQIGEFVKLPPGWLPADGSTFRKENFPNLARILGSTTLPTVAPVYGLIVGIRAS